MGYRTHARHTTCPGCREEVYIEELVGGDCPLCGSSVGDVDASEEEIQFDDSIERSELSWLVLQYFLFRKFQEYGAHPLQVYRLLSRIDEEGECPAVPGENTRFALDADLSRMERILPKRCSTCRRVIFFGGAKKIIGDLVHGDMTIRFLCSDCVCTQDK
ncbi:hypothetical protein J2T58_000616 [Methanocalculus alkaliphilus]|uniref:hypothetical protein n=1 Tax=Methanocalculus alkaliphilus TaxID=768730 RepID=UPI00209E0C1C|nr:hypothetical protein [Methanocalculus alkaliphilus]MCP1714771.1 hypothetical protein [Methanocalculus alkaliphilus]